MKKQIISPMAELTVDEIAYKLVANTNPILWIDVSSDLLPQVYEALLLIIKLEDTDQKLAAFEAIVNSPSIKSELGKNILSRTLQLCEHYLTSKVLEDLIKFNQFINGLVKIGRTSKHLRSSILGIMYKLASDSTDIKTVLGISKFIIQLYKFKGEPKPSALVLANIADNLSEAGESEHALLVCNIGLQCYLYDPHLLSIRIKLLKDIGDLKNVKNDLDILIKLNPKEADTLMTRAEVLLSQDMEELALRDIDLYLRSKPDDTKALMLKAEILSSIDQTSEALEIINTLMEKIKDEEKSDFLLKRAYIYRDLGLSTQAMADIDTVLSKEPENPKAKILSEEMFFQFGSENNDDEVYSSFVKGDAKSMLAEQETVNIRFSDIGDLTEAKEAVREALEYPLKYPELSVKYGRTAGGGVLLFGPPGCGKTMLAKAAATECDVKFYNVNLATVLDKWVGNSEKAISMIFKTARKNSPAIIFFDELDSIGASRQGLQAGWERKLISQLLVELDGIQGNPEKVMVLGATNNPWSIDMALRRAGRFGRPIYIPPPDKVAREEILKLYANKIEMIDQNIDYQHLAAITEHHSADSLRQLVLDAASIPWKKAIKGDQQLCITQADFELALKKRPADLAEWLKLLSQYEEFAKQAEKIRTGIGFSKPPPKN